MLSAFCNDELILLLLTLSSFCRLTPRNGHFNVTNAKLCSAPHFLCKDTCWSTTVSPSSGSWGQMELLSAVLLDPFRIDITEVHCELLDNLFKAYRRQIALCSYSTINHIMRYFILHHLFPVFMVCMEKDTPHSVRCEHCFETQTFIPS